MRSARGGVMVKLLIFLLVAGLAAYEAGAVLIARVKADSTAADAASDAASEYSNSGSTTKAEAAAAADIDRDGGTMASFTIDPARRQVTVVVRRRARTIVVQRIGPLKKYGTVDVSHTSTAP
ncbi:MAG: hypothetical protein ABR552_00710 [Actinomycetota bacterium]